MIETLLGGLLGGAFRLAPEILKWLDRQGQGAGVRKDSWGAAHGGDRGQCGCGLEYRGD